MAVMTRKPSMCSPPGLVALTAPFPRAAVAAASGAAVPASGGLRATDGGKTPWRRRCAHVTLSVNEQEGSVVAAIVCGIDESPGALEALRVASALSAQFDARLVLAHIADGWAAGSDESLTTSQARQGGNRMLERAAREHDVKAERRVEVGEPAEALARIASEEAASMIIVGSRREGRRPPHVRSGLARGLAAAAPCPVVVVPPTERG